MRSSTTAPHARRIRRSPWPLLLGFAVGCERPLDVPEPPDLTPLAAEYDSPTARLENDNVSLFLQELEERLELLDTLGGLLGVVSTVRELSGGDATGSDAGSGVLLDKLPVDADAVVRLQGDCGNAPGDDGAFGHFDALVVILDRVLHPVVWGEVHDCIAERTVRSVQGVAQFDGEFAVYSPRLSRLDKKQAQEDILVTFHLTRLVMNGIVLDSVRGDFRLRGGKTEFLVDLGSAGTALLVTGGTGKVEVRGAEETRICELETRECDFGNAR